MQNFTRVMSIALLLFFAVLAVVLGSRMDQATIALLGGTTIGLLIATPCAALVTYYVLRRHDHGIRDASTNLRAPMPQSPPQYWVVQHPSSAGFASYPRVDQPLLQTALPQAPPSLDFALPAVRRRFYMIGEAGDVEELDDVGSQFE